MNTVNPASSIPNHLAWSIIATVLAICLCCPLGLVGIVAIVFSSKVNNLLAQGDIDGGLVGGASLKAQDFLQIIAAAGS